MEKTKLPLHKREEIKRKEEEQRAKEVYEEFVATFVDDSPDKVGKTFVRGEVVNEDDSKHKIGTAYRLYKPSPTLFKPPSALDQARRQAEEKAKKIMEEAMKNRPEKLGKKKEDKRTSNLEAFKEELKRAQEEREQRRQLRQQLKDQLGSDKQPLLDRIVPSLDNPYLGTFDADPTTTNVFLSNISPKLTEDELCKVFGHFGPLASVKIMWPRTEDEKARGYNTGFIAFMTRKDSERAVAKLRGKIILGHEMKLNWGKGVPMPAHPVYVPPRMVEMALPPPLSGLPFNAQPLKEDLEAYCRRWPLPPQGAPPPVDPEQRQAWEKMIRNATVKVVIPTERQLLCAIHRVVEFAIREGPIFEAVLMNKELNNNLYRFLFDNHSPAHVYYRWKLFSLLQGDSPTKWRTTEFRLFDNGSLWLPPPMNFYHQGLPRELYEDDEEEDDEEWVEKAPVRVEDRRGLLDEHKSDEGSPPPTQSAMLKKGQLSDRQRCKLKTMLEELTVERDKICDAMLYCVDHAESAEEILDMICESLFDADSSIAKKVAKLYLISDILNNCTAKVANVSYFRKHIAARLEDIFKHINLVYEKIEARLKAEQVKQRIMACFRSWEDTVVYPGDFLINLQNIFLGLTIAQHKYGPGSDDLPETDSGTFPKANVDDNVTSTASRPSLFKSLPQTDSDKPLKKLVDYDLDGVPLDDDEYEAEGSSEIIQKPNDIPEKKDVTSFKPAFIKSKWEEVDPEQETVVTSSRWEELERQAKDEKIFSDNEEDIDGIPLEEATSENGEVPDSPTFPDTTTAKSRSSDSRQSPESFTKEERSIESITDEKRQKLREIELKVMKFQDELESGTKKRSSGMNIQEEVAKYRQKLLQKIEKETEEKRHKTDSSKKDSDSTKHHKSKKSTSDRDGESPSSRGRSSEKSRSSAKEQEKSSERETKRGKDRRKQNGDDEKERSKKRSRSRSPRKSRRKSSSKSPSDVSRSRKKKR